MHKLFFLPHDMFAAIYHNYPEIWRTSISPDVTKLVEFWNAQTGHPPSDETEKPAQQQGAQEESEEAHMSDDTNEPAHQHEVLDRGLRGKRRRRRSSSTSSSEQYHHRKIKKHWVALGAKLYKRKAARD